MNTKALRTVVLIAVPLAACTLPNQNTIPPNVRVTYYSGNTNNAVDQTTGLPVQHVLPNQPITIIAQAWSSLAGLKSLELDPASTFNCYQGNIGQTGSPLYAPIVKTAPPNVLTLSAEMDLGPPAANCQSGWRVQWSGSFTAKAVGRDGLTTTSKQLNLVSP
jgi:hypothetical protein